MQPMQKVSLEPCHRCCNRNTLALAYFLYLRENANLIHAHSLMYAFTILTLHMQTFMASYYLHINRVENSLGGSSVGSDRLLSVCSQKAAGDRRSSAGEEQSLTSGQNCGIQHTEVKQNLNYLVK